MQHCLHADKPSARTANSTILLPFCYPLSTLLPSSSLAEPTISSATTKFRSGWSAAGDLELAIGPVSVEKYVWRHARCFDFSCWQLFRQALRCIFLYKISTTLLVCFSHDRSSLCFLLSFKWCLVSHFVAARFELWYWWRQRSITFIVRLTSGML